MRKEQRAERPKNGPSRTCVGCGRHDDAASLVRVVLGPRVPNETASVAVDLAGGSFGRGAHVHARKGCLAKAAKGGLARAFKCRVEANEGELAGQIASAADRRIAGLLMGARRAGHVSVGADAAGSAIAKAAAEGVEACLVVASDAASVVEKGPMAAAIAEGKAVAWKSKAELGALFGRDEIAVCAVIHESVAAQVMAARRLADAAANAVTGRSDGRRPPSEDTKMAAETSRTGDAWKSREVR